MSTNHRAGQRLRVWVRRYLPSEIAGTTAQFTAAGVVYSSTRSWAAAAVAATIFASVGYYSIAYISAVRWSMAEHAFGRANLLALRSITVEFGPAEVIDSLAIRPAALYLGPALTGSTLLGLIAGKLVADVGFYGCTVLSFETFRNLLAHKQMDRDDR